MSRTKRNRWAEMSLFNSLQPWSYGNIRSQIAHKLYKAFFYFCTMTYTDGTTISQWLISDLIPKNPKSSNFGFLGIKSEISHLLIFIKSVRVADASAFTTSRPHTDPRIMLYILGVIFECCQIFDQLTRIFNISARLHHPCSATIRERHVEIWLDRNINSFMDENWMPISIQLE